MVVPLGWYPSCLTPQKTLSQGDNILNKYPRDFQVSFLGGFIIPPRVPCHFLYEWRTRHLNHPKMLGKLVNRKTNSFFFGSTFTQVHSCCSLLTSTGLRHSAQNLPWSVHKDILLMAEILHQLRLVGVTYKQKYIYIYIFIYRSMSVYLYIDTYRLRPKLT